MSIELKNIEGVFWIDREEATKKLTDGFVELFGEENRDFFESLQDAMIDEGINAGKSAYRIDSLSRMSMIKVFKEIKTEDENAIIKSWFLKFFTQKEYDLVIKGKVDSISGGVTGSLFPYYKNQEKYEAMFVERFNIKNCDGKCNKDGECYCNSNPPKLYKKSPPSFKYFKNLKHSFLSLNMFGEGGLSLDRWNSSELNYMLEENEWFYYPESIHRSYYYLGAQIGKCYLKEEFFNEILNKLEKDIPYEMQSTLKSALAGLSTDYDETFLYPLINKEYENKFGVNDDFDGFKTRKEISESLQRIYKEIK